MAQRPTVPPSLSSAVSSPVFLPHGGGWQPHLPWWACSVMATTSPVSLSACLIKAKPVVAEPPIAAEAAPDVATLLYHKSISHAYCSELSVPCHCSQRTFAPDSAHRHQQRIIYAPKTIFAISSICNWACAGGSSDDVRFAQRRDAIRAMTDPRVVFIGILCTFTARNAVPRALRHPSAFATDTGRPSRSVGATGLPLSPSLWRSHIVCRFCHLLNRQPLHHHSEPHAGNEE